MLRTIEISLLLGFCLTVYAQYESPVAYLNFLNEADEELSKSYMSYVSAVAHSNSARKMEKKRLQVIGEIKTAREKVTGMRGFNKDPTLRDTYIEYYRLIDIVFREDYGKIVNLEEIAEQSYDNMEAYLMAQEMAQEKMKEEADKREASFRAFAGQHEVKLIESQSKLSQNLARAKKVNHYYNQVYLVFFKAVKQEAYLIASLNDNDINGIEQNKVTLAKNTVEGLEKLKEIGSFNGDQSLREACRKMLEFLKFEADTRISVMTDYLLKKEEFEKIKEVFDAKPQNSRTQADLDAFNKWVNDVNKAGAVYNKANEETNAGRGKVTTNWNNTARKFLDTHVP